jgi:hypothetical protein
MAYSVQANDSGIKPKYHQPVDKNILHTIQSGDSTAANKLEVDGGLESNDNKQEEVMDTDEDQPAQPIVFKIDPDIDINSSALKDMVSTDHSL